MPFRACPMPLFLQITHSHGHMGRSGSPSNMWFLLVHQSPQHKHLHWFSRFCAPQSVHIIYNGLPFSHHNCHFPFLWGIWTHLHVIHGFIRGVSALEVLRLCAIQIYILLTYLLTYLLSWAHPSLQPERHLDWFSRFAQFTAECPYTWLRAAPSPLKIVPSRVGICTPIYPWVHPTPEPKLHLDRFSRFSIVTDRQTDGPTDRPTDHATRTVTIGRI